MKKIITIATLSLILFLGFSQSSDKGFAGKLYPLDGHSFELIQKNEEVNNVSIKVDKNGYFYNEVIEGPDAGNFELWDGEKF